MNYLFKHLISSQILLLSLFSGPVACQKRPLSQDPGTKLLANTNPCTQTIKARFENRSERFHEVELKVVDSEGIYKEFGIIRGKISDNHLRIQNILNEIKNHLMVQGDARTPAAYQPKIVDVNRLLNELEGYLESEPFRGQGQIYLSTPTFRIVNPYLNRTGGNIHVDSTNVPKDFFKDNQIFKGFPAVALPASINKKLEEDRNHGGDPNKSLNGKYYNIWINLFNKDDSRSGLIFGPPARLSDLKDREKFRPFEFMGVTTLKVIYSPDWKNTIWLKPSKMNFDDFLIFPTRTSVHGAIDPLVPDVPGVFRASVEVRFVLFKE